MKQPKVSARSYSAFKFSQVLLCCILVTEVTCHVNCLSAQTLEERLISEKPESLVADIRRDGDAVRGAAVFYTRSLACSTCHSVGDRPESIGPDLVKIDPKTSDAALIEAVLQPSKTIAPAYATVTIETLDGQTMTGLLVEETEEQLVLRDVSQSDKLHRLKKSDIEDRHSATQSIMPDGQINQLTDRGQFLDLMRYLIELRDGGAERARELQPVPDPLAQKVPEEPLPWKPVVQRGEVAVKGNLKYPHAVALGFAGGTVLFDANQLTTVATWHEGFVKHSPQNYFGLFWHRDGSTADKIESKSHPLQFQQSDQSTWQPFEPAIGSDPNTGTRFDGYQIGSSAVRLHYRVLVGDKRIQVTEDVRAESRQQWQGYVREFRFHGLPTGARVSLALPELAKEGKFELHNASGEILDESIGKAKASLVSFPVNGATKVVRINSENSQILRSDEADRDLRLMSVTAKQGEPVVLRIDTWKYRGISALPRAAELASLVEQATELDDSFDQPIKASTELPPVEYVETDLPVKEQKKRPAVDAKQNVDEFPATRGKFLRFVVTKTTGNSEPGIDELQIFGTDPNVNLALKGTASASSVISGYKIHQIPHLNDGKLGNNNSWISSEKGGGWAQIEFAEPVEMNKIVWARDQTGVCKDRQATAYRIEISDDGENWKKVGDESGRSATALVAIRRDASPGYEMEAIPLPFPTCRPSDIAFADDGTMYAIAMTEGQIWRTRIPPEGHPRQVHWHRYATGLYHPIGLAIVDDKLYVAQKTEITELIDRNGDGTVDHYRTVATGWGLSTGWHEYCFGLAVDPQKNLWFALNTGYFWTNPGYVNPGRWRGSILRVAHETEKLEVMAKGCRVPNGITQGPDGNIFFTDNQGDWVQACKLAHVVPGRFYGHPEYKDDALSKDTYPDGLSTVWLPYHLSRSSSGPVHDKTQGKFGPFANQIFLGDVGYGANQGVMRIALEKVDGEYQGACFRFVDGQPLGCERMKFGPDHQLYMASLTSGLTRMAFNGQTPLAIQAVNIRTQGKGFVVKLTQPLSSETKLDPKQFQIKQYHYLYTGNYGSPQADEKKIPVESVQLSVDRKEITLNFPVETYPIGMVYEINLGTLNGLDNKPLTHNEAWYTVHRIPK